MSEVEDEVCMYRSTSFSFVNPRSSFRYPRQEHELLMTRLRYFLLQTYSWHSSTSLFYTLSRPTMSRTAFFVIDIQRALADSRETEIPHARRIRDVGASILDKVRANMDEAQSRGEAPGMDIIIVQHEETPDKGDLQLGTRAWQLVFPPRPSPYEILVSKNVRTYPSSHTPPHPPLFPL